MRRGRSPRLFTIRSASHVAMHPPPSSVAPVPTSHESKWPPDDHDFFRSFAPADFRDDVRGLDVREKVRLHAEADGHAGAARLEPLQPLGIFGGDRGRGDARRAVGISERARVGRSEADRADRPQQHRDRAERGDPRRPVRPILHRLAVRRERHVEHDDPTLHVGGARLQVGEALTRRAFRPRCRPPACRRFRRGRASRAEKGRARRSRHSPGRGPIAAP